jgi:hypothetical protein
VVGFVAFALVACTSSHAELPPTPAGVHAVRGEGFSYVYRYSPGQGAMEEGAVHSSMAALSAELEAFAHDQGFPIHQPDDLVGLKVVHMHSLLMNSPSIRAAVGPGWGRLRGFYLGPDDESPISRIYLSPWEGHEQALLAHELAHFYADVHGWSARPDAPGSEEIAEAFEATQGGG